MSQAYSKNCLCRLEELHLYFFFMLVNRVQVDNNKNPILFNFIAGNSTCTHIDTHMCAHAQTDTLCVYVRVCVHICVGSDEKDIEVL